MNVRRATEGDHDVLRELWTAFADELDGPPFLRESWETAWPDLSRHIREGISLLCEREGRVMGFLFATFDRSLPLAHVTDLYVVPEARRQGATKALFRELAGELARRGVGHVGLDVASGNRPAQAVYERFGFVEYERFLATSVAELALRLSDSAGPAPSFGSIHVQTDDAPAVERAVRQFVPRLPGGSRQTVLAPPRNGWIAVYDELCDREPELLRRLARELSDRMGTVTVALGVEQDAVVRYVMFERGRIVDEYMSVPEHYGPLPPGDVVALAANPRVAARLTGADAAEVRAVARTAASPGELPPPREHLAQLAGALHVEGAEYGYAGLPELAGATRVEHR